MGWRVVIHDHTRREVFSFESATRTGCIDVAAQWLRDNPGLESMYFFLSEID